MSRSSFLLTSEDARGEKNNNAALTAEKVREIRRLWASGKYRQTEIGRRFGVTASAVSCVVTRKNWAHVE